MRVRPLLSALSVAVALTAVACGGSHGTRRPRDPGPPVIVAVRSALEMEGSAGAPVAAGLEPFRRATPGTVIMGRVTEIRRREGDRVRAGEILARVESRDVDARRAQAEAGLAAARALEKNARLMRERMERLVSRQAASQKNLDDAVTGHEAALAQVKAAEEGLAAADVMVGYADVRAPFAGTVTERRTETGDIAAPGMPLFTVEDLSKMKVEAQVGESRLAGLSVGRKVEVLIPSASPLYREGTLAEILPAADPASRTFRVRVILDNPGEALRSGTYARLRIPGVGTTVLAVDESAVVRRGPLTGVFVVDDEGVARLRYVTLGDARDGRVEVLTGLRAEDRVVTAPPPELEDGRRVEVRG